MYQIMYKPNDKDEYQCLGSSTDSEHALEEMDKLEAGPLGEKGVFKLVRKGNKEEKSCKKCKALCSGSGKEGNANQCTFYTTEEEEEVYKW